MIEITQVNATLDEPATKTPALLLADAPSNEPCDARIPRLKPLSSIASQSTPVKSEMFILF